jgi:acyl carrier protein
MDENLVEKEIISIIADVSGEEEENITAETNLVNDLEIDSIKSIEIVVAIEKKYKISVRDEEIPQITMVNQVVDLTKKLLMQKDNS